MIEKIKYSLSEFISNKQMRLRVLSMLTALTIAVVTLLHTSIHTIEVFDGEKIFKNGLPIFLNKAIKQRPPDLQIHTHDFIEISYVFSGKGTHQILDKSIDISKGDLFLINPNIPHRFMSAPDYADDEFVIYNFDFSADLISEANIQINRNNKNGMGIIIAIIAFIIGVGGTLVVINHNKRLKDIYEDKRPTPESTIESDDNGDLEMHTTDEDWNHDTIEYFNNIEEEHDIIEYTDDGDWDPDPYNSWDPTDSGWGY